MRLIDADALIKQFELCRLSKNEIYQIIHESPTVEERPTINCKDCDGYEAGYSAGLKDAEKPQGEWVRKEDIIHYIATQYSEHNELVPVWLNIGDIRQIKTDPKSSGSEDK